MRRIRKPVVVNLSDGKTVIIGTRIASNRHQVTLVDAQVSWGKGDWVKVDGKVEVPMSSVDYVQVTG